MGSSKKITRGSPIIAMATFSRRFIPPDSVFTCASALSIMPIYTSRPRVARTSVRSSSTFAVTSSAFTLRSRANSSKCSLHYLSQPLRENTVSTLIIRFSWKQTPRLRRTSSSWFTRDLPYMIASPSVGPYMPVSTLISVDLPAPL